MKETLKNERIKKYIEILEKIIYYGIPICILLWCIQMVFNDSIWLDEAFSLSIIEQSFIDIIKNTAIDVHPPLYYIVLKIIISITNLFAKNDVIMVAKLVSVVPIIILMFISYKKIAKLFGKKVAFLFNLFILGVPQIMQYAIEIRMYSLGLLFVTCFFIYFVEWDRYTNKKSYIMKIVFALLSAYTHYFAGVSVAIIYLLFFVEAMIKKDWNKLKKIALSMIISILLYTPWIIIFIKQLLVVKEDYWIGEITTSTIKSFLRYPYVISSSKILTNVMRVIILVSLISLFKKNTDKKYAIYGLLVPYGTIAIGLIASYIIRPVFINRYMVCSLGVFYLAIAINLAKLINKKSIFTIMVLIVLSVTVYSNCKLINKEREYKEKTIDLINYMDGINNKEDIVIIFDNSYLQRVISYLYPNIDTYLYKGEITELTKKVYRQTSMDILENIDIEGFNQNKKEIYIFATKDAIMSDIEEKEYEYEKIDVYGIETYEFSIYKISYE